MKKINVRDCRVLYRFLISYICILIPVLVLSIWMVNSMKIERDCELEAQIEKQLEYALTQLDSSYEYYETSQVAIASNENLYESKMLGNMANTITGIETIKNLAKFLPEVYILFLDYGDGYYYSNAGLTKAATFCERTLSLDGEAECDFRDTVASETECVRIISSSTDTRYLLFHFSQKLYQNTHRVSVNYLIRESDVVAQIKQPVEDYIVWLSVDTQSDAGSIYYRNSSFESAQNRLLTVSSKHFTLRACCDLDNMWHQEAARWRNWYIMIAASMLVLSILSILISRSNYKPVKQIVERVHGAGKYSAINVRNEYEYIDGFIRNMMSECVELRQRLDSEKLLLRRQSATLIFNGMIAKRSDIQARLDYADIAFDYEYYFVAVYKSVNREEIERIEANSTDLMSMIVDKNGVCLLAVLFGLNTSNSDEEARQLRAAERAKNTEATISVSSVYDDLETVSLAYNEAEQGFSKSILPATEVLLETLRRAFFDRNKDLALETLERIRQHSTVKTDETGLIERVKQIVLTGIVSDDQDASIALDSLKKEIVSENDNAWSLLAHMVNSMKAEAEYNEAVNTALEFINKNYRDNRLSLDLVAEHCGLSPAYLSKLFKRSIGKGYLEYVTTLRMNEAERLFISTAKSASEIAENVGYIDISSFRRKFRQVKGISISALRQE